jgi:S1-C subfamily serine protease
MFDANTMKPTANEGRERLDELALDAYSSLVASVAERVGPAVVRVEGRAGGRGGIGSGVVIADDGLVLTNSHVVAGARRVRLALAEGGEAEGRRRSWETIPTPISRFCAPGCRAGRRSPRSATPSG